LISANFSHFPDITIATDLFEEKGAQVKLPLSGQPEEEEMLLRSLARCNQGKLLEKMSVEKAHAKSKNFALLESAKHGRIECVDLFIRCGADIKAVDANKWNALHFAVADNRNDIVKPLIDRKIDLDAQDKDGMTPLMFAAMDGNCECVETLLENGANTNLVATNDHDELNALHFATFHGNKVTVERLVMNGCDVNARDKYGRTPLMLAALKGKTDTVQYLLENTKVCF
jgi:ankyrin repeat protein